LERVERFETIFNTKSSVTIRASNH